MLSIILYSNVKILVKQNKVAGPYLFSTNCIVDKICLDLPSTFTESPRMRAHPRQAVLCVSMATPVTSHFESKASRGLERPALQCTGRHRDLLSEIYRSTNEFIINILRHKALTYRSCRGKLFYYFK